MIKRLGAVFSAIVARYRMDRLREVIAEARRLRRVVIEQREEIRGLRTRSVLTEGDLTDERRRSDAAEQECEKLRGELDILKARDVMWVAWEARERARIDAETARFAAGKTRALDFPQLEPEDRQ